MLKLETIANGQGNTDLLLKHDEVVVLSGSIRSGEAVRASNLKLRYTEWPVRQEKRLYFLQKLREFYEGTKFLQRERGNPNIPENKYLGLYIGGNSVAKYKGVDALEELLSKCEEAKLSDFAITRFYTQYVNFWLATKGGINTDKLQEDIRGGKFVSLPLWTPEITPPTAVLGVGTHEDLSVPHSRLFLNTTPYSLDEAQVLQIFKEIYKR